MLVISMLPSVVRVKTHLHSLSLDTNLRCLQFIFLLHLFLLAFNPIFLLQFLLRYLTSETVDTQFVVPLCRALCEMLFYNIFLLLQMQ